MHARPDAVIATSSATRRRRFFRNLNSKGAAPPDDGRILNNGLGDAAANGAKLACPSAPSSR
jgi:hypothetical protein